MKDILNDYRCSCKKLLFKGFIFVGEVEIRCRFCKRTNTISGLNGNLSNKFRYVLISNDQGDILKATSSANTTLGYKDSDIKKLKVHEIITSLTPALYQKIWLHLNAEIARSILFRAEHTKKDGTSETVQVNVRGLASQLDGQKLFIFDISCKVPQKLKKLSFSLNDEQ